MLTYTMRYKGAKISVIFLFVCFFIYVFLECIKVFPMDVKIGRYTANSVVQKCNISLLYVYLWPLR